MTETRLAVVAACMQPGRAAWARSHGACQMRAWLHSLWRCAAWVQARTDMAHEWVQVLAVAAAHAYSLPATEVAGKHGADQRLPLWPVADADHA